MTHSRRQFLRTAGALGAASAFPLIGCAKAAKVVVIGGGFGGATAARYVKAFDPNLEVTLIEPSKTYTTCPFSNAYLGGLRDLASITHNYTGLAKAGVRVMHDRATGLDPAKKTVMTADNGMVAYDRLIVSPGIDFKWGMGYDEAASQTVPHAWKAGSQTVTLRKQLEAMDDGGVFVMCPPPNPFRCPPGPYERASMVAWYLKNNKPKSKLLILDAKDKFSKQPLFQEGWAQQYKDLIEWVPAANGGKVEQIDAKTRTVTTEFGSHKANVLNFIPAQKAGKIAFAMGLTDAKGWCPVDLFTFESKIHKRVHVIGDAATVPGMPKSGNAANSEAKACAAAVVSLLRGAKPSTPTTSNTCYSLITPNYGISVTAVWEATAEKYAKKSGGVSPKGRDAEFRRLESKYARGWYNNITTDVWG